MLPWVSAFVQALREAGIDAGALAVAWARFIPVVLIVPAFGMAGLGGGLRWAIALLVGASLCPVSLGSLRAAPQDSALARALLESLASGTFVAFAAAAPLWAATMAGSLFDSAWRLSPERPGAFSTLLTLLSTAIFFATGAPARIAGAVTAPSPPGILDAAVLQVMHGIDIAVAIGAPILFASLAIDTITVAVTRAAGPSWAGAVSLPIRALGLLLLAAALMERVTWAIAAAVVGR